MAHILFLVKIYPDCYLMNIKFIIMLTIAIYMKGEKRRILINYQMVNYFTNELTKMVKSLF